MAEEDSTDTRLTRLKRALDDRAEVRRENAAIVFLEELGYRACTALACNCGSWHLSPEGEARLEERDARLRQRTYDRVVETLRPDYPDAVNALQRRLAAEAWAAEEAPEAAPPPETTTPTPTEWEMDDGYLCATVEIDGRKWGLEIDNPDEAGPYKWRVRDDDDWTQFGWGCETVDAAKRAALAKATEWAGEDKTDG